MRRFTLFAALLVLSAAPAALAPAGGREAAAGREEAASGGERAHIELDRERVYVAGEVVLRATLSPRRPARFEWRATGGRLLVDDRAEAVLETPSGGDSVDVEVRARPLDAGRAAPPLTASMTIPLHLPSTRGMVRIPGGVVTIGNTWTDVDHPEYIETLQNKADKPAHEVRLTPYWIDRDRVTNARYRAFLEECLERKLIEVTPIAVFGRPSGRTSDAMVPFFRFSHDDMRGVADLPRLRKALRWDGARFTVEPGSEHCPVVDVTWAGADAFARYYGKRLPTSAEWEHAARGNDGRYFPWGDELPTPLHANLNYAYGDRLFPVGSFSPLGDSPYGVRDMLGGVFEWVHDWYNENYYEDVASDRPIVDPRGPNWGKDHVIRGAYSSMGFTGTLHEQPPLSFRYQWFFEFPEVGDSVATFDTGFRTAVTDFESTSRNGSKPRVAAAASPTGPSPGGKPGSR